LHAQNVPVGTYLHYVPAGTLKSFAPCKHPQDSFIPSTGL
jgi:hypothetical protein